jgi:tetratricopeptide (TPR) repeat protein
VAGYALMGIVHHDEHRPGPAVAANEKVLELDPQLEALTLPPDLFFADLAQDLVDVNRAGDARRYIHRILGQRDDPVLIDILGSAYYSEGQEDDAERCWKRAIELDPRFHRPWLNLGKLALRRGRLDEAVPFLEKAHSLDRTIHEPAYQLSLAYRRLGRAVDSERYRKLAETLRLNNPKNKRGMGLVPNDKP